MAHVGLTHQASLVDSHGIRMTRLPFPSQKKIVQHCWWEDEGKETHLKNRARFFSGSCSASTEVKTRHLSNLCERIMRGAVLKKKVQSPQPSSETSLLLQQSNGGRKELPILSSSSPVSFAFLAWEGGEEQCRVGNLQAKSPEWPPRDNT